MFKEILKIIPRLDNKDLNNMERSLTQRFGKIAKKFGSGLGKALGAGGVAGIALGLIEKLLNPLKEVQESIDKMLTMSDDIQTNAEQFGTTSGRLFKLVALGKATGLDQDSLFQLMNKFQNKVAEAEADPEKATSVRAYVGQKDSGEAFFNFIQSLKKMDKNDQLLVQQEVFGEKQILKMSDFLNAKFDVLLSRMRLAPSKNYDEAFKGMSGFKDEADLLDARRMGKDVLDKSRLINGNMITARDKQLNNELSRENERIGNYQALMTVSETSAKILGIIEKDMMSILKRVAPAVEKIGNLADKLPSSRIIKWGLSLVDGK